MGLFSGIGGFEMSFARHGYECAGLCEIDPVAQAVLRDRFPGVKIHEDITKMKTLPRANILTAGFPCQDLSQAGTKVGITGERSGLVDHIFRLLEDSRYKPEWVVLENVSYMLKLKSGGAMQYILKRIEELGYNWAYRVLDARAFGVPQRRERVVLLMSKKHDPSLVLFPDNKIESCIDDSVGSVNTDCLYGFYWTEGKRGLGWTKNAVPTIKRGSGLGIPSPPAIWDPQTGLFGTPSLGDAERMFGYPAGWTEAAYKVNPRPGSRWHLVGNTICVPMVDWVVEQIMNPQGLGAEVYSLTKKERPPKAAYGLAGKRFGVDVSMWPKKGKHPDLRGFLNEDLKPLSLRASSGFYSRAINTKTIRFADGFLNSLDEYIEKIKVEGVI
jgi:DNA (cytosine-5)-methyltransferase 1